MILLAAINWHSVYFLLFSLVACVFAAGVLFTSNIVRMAFYLVISLGATAGLFFLAGAHFVGAMQLMIYVGGTMVLLIFGVMLTAQERFITMKTSGGEWVTALVVGGSMLALLLAAALSVESWRTPPEDQQAQMVGAEQNQTTKLAMAMVGGRYEGYEADASDTDATVSGYLLPFEIVSVHLLVVLIGAAYLARTKRRAK